MRLFHLLRALTRIAWKSEQYTRSKLKGATSRFDEMTYVLKIYNKNKYGNILGKTVHFFEN